MQENVYQSNMQGMSEASNEKLRSTCDSCALSKVRCNKQKPVCRRCMTSKLDCVYGQSQRKGKPASKRSRPTNQLPNPIESQPSACATPQHALPPTPQSSTPRPLTWWTRQDFPDTFTGFPFASEDDIRSEDMLNDRLWTYGLESTLDSHEALGSELSGIITKDSSITASNDQSQAFPSPADGPSHFMSCTLPPDLTSISGHLTPNPDHLCTTIALDTLLDLYQSRRQTPNSIIGLSSDQILQTNRKAVQTLDRLLSCDCNSCHHDSNMYFLVATISSKVIAWYRAVSNGIMHTDPPSYPSSPRQSSASNEEAFAITSITIGEFKLDRIAEARMKAQLLLCELQNAGKVLDVLAQCNRGCSSNDLRSIERGVYKAFEQFLRSSLNDLVTRLDQFCFSRG